MTRKKVVVFEKRPRLKKFFNNNIGQHLNFLDESSEYNNSLMARAYRSCSFISHEWWKKKIENDKEQKIEQEDWIEDQKQIKKILEEKLFNIQIILQNNELKPDRIDLYYAEELLSRDLLSRFEFRLLESRVEKAIEQEQELREIKKEEQIEAWDRQYGNWPDCFPPRKGKGWWEKHNKRF